VDNIATDLKDDTSNRDVAIKQVTQLLTEIHDQTETLSQFSSEYNVKLQKSIDGV
jgi:flagellar hook-associated protein FlgK